MKIKFLIGILFLAVYISPAQSSDNIYQVSTINALLDGIYDGSESYKKIKLNGDFGIGTFNGLFGEMLALDGEFYQIQADGKLYEVSDEMLSPFATVVFFKSDFDNELKKALDYKELQKMISNDLPSKNLFYAIKITGKFKYMKTRSVPKQDRPYPSLVEVVKKQPIFEFNDIEGTMVGFYCPEYAKGVNVPGYHFHFITEDKQGGGHILELKTDSGKIEIDSKHNFSMSLPNNVEFYELDLKHDKETDLNTVEKDK